jgi:hypothetical protein
MEVGQKDPNLAGPFGYQWTSTSCVEILLLGMNIDARCGKQCRDHLPHTTCICSLHHHHHSTLHYFACNLCSRMLLHVTTQQFYHKRRVLESINKTSFLCNILERRGKFTKIMRNFTSILGTMIVPHFIRCGFVSPAMMSRCLRPYMMPCGKYVAETYL